MLHARSLAPLVKARGRRDDVAGGGCCSPPESEVVRARSLTRQQNAEFRDDALQSPDPWDVPLGCGTTPESEHPPIANLSFPELPYPDPDFERIDAGI